ncbi:MAG: hypothetical protein R3Y24_15180 [Eubacteriales bacterium]
MLTFEQVLEVFNEYINEDEDCQVVITKQGYTVMMWDCCMMDWIFVTYCGTPVKLRNTMMNNFYHFWEWKYTSGERDLTKDEKKKLKNRCEELKIMCKKKVAM